MSIFMCAEHGRQPGEKVSKLLLEQYKSGVDISNEVRDFLVILDDFECPFFGLAADELHFPGINKTGIFLVQDDDDLAVILKSITVMCLGCLKAAMRGRQLPSKDV